MQTENIQQTPLAHSIQAAGTRIGLGRATIYELIAAQKLRTFKVGRRTFIAESELQRFVAERMGNAA